MKRKKDKGKEKFLRIDKVRFDAEGFPQQEGRRMVINGYVPLPPKEDTPENLRKRQAYITELDLLDLKGDPLILPCKGESFKETKNPVYLIEAYLLAYRNGIYPPLWVMDFIAGAFEKYHKAHGYEQYTNRERTTLDQLFGFGKGKGETLSFKKLLLEQRDEKLMIDICRLRKLFNVSIETAVKMVAAKLSAMPYDDFDRTGLKLKKIGFDKLKEKYFKKWKGLLEGDNVFAERFAETLLKWTEGDKVTYLKTFPLDCVPHSLKRLLKQPCP